MARASENQLRRNKILISAALGFFFISACQTLPHPQTTVSGRVGSAQGQWRAKALVKNLKTQKSVTLDLDVIAQEPDSLRIEALGPFSMHVASIASQGHDVQISLTREKKFIVTSATRDALAQVVPVRVSPSDLLAILFDRPLDAKNSGWACERASDSGALWSCRSGTALVVRQVDEDGRRRFQFSAPEAEMNLVVTEAHSATPLAEASYKLQPPSGYRIEKPPTSPTKLN